MPEPARTTLTRDRVASDSMDRTRTIRWLALGTVYVFLSSWFGLTGPQMGDGDMEAAIDFFVNVWTDSLAADLVFVAGTLAAGYLAWHVLARLDGWQAPAASIGLGGLAHWGVYLASYLLLGDVANQNVEGVWESLIFVGDWGKLGLILAATLPSMLAWFAQQGHINARIVPPLSPPEES